ncbi:hypothetical protein [Amycolatopsis sp. lyj-90]|uniref:hypothetical protein n=1 Tax=Amycolatopsis sp. lyj-90 TaxID=2789285 RepID=UPI003978AAD5
MPDGGYKADSEAMLTASTSLERAAEKTTSEAGKVGPTQVGPENFGRVHKDHQKGYATGILAISDAMKGYAGQLTQLAGGVSTASTRYTSSDQANAAAANKAGTQ